MRSIEAMVLPAWLYRTLMSAGMAAAGLTLASSPVGAQERPSQHRIVFENGCRYPIRLLIEHADGYRNWHPHGWYNYDGFEKSGLRSEGVTLTQSDGHDLYFYAESTDNSGKIWEGKDSYVTFEGSRYGLLKANSYMSGGNLNVKITCNN